MGGGDHVSDDRAAKTAIAVCGVDLDVGNEHFTALLAHRERAHIAPIDLNHVILGWVKPVSESLQLIRVFPAPEQFDVRSQTRLPPSVNQHEVGVGGWTEPVGRGGVGDWHGCP